MKKVRLPAGPDPLVLPQHQIQERRKLKTFYGSSFDTDYGVTDMRIFGFMCEDTEFSETL